MEYALILVLVAVVVIAVLLILGPVIGNVFTKINSTLAPHGIAGGGGGAGNPPPAATATTPPVTLSYICQEPPDCPGCPNGVIDVTVNGVFGPWWNCTVGATGTYPLSGFPSGSVVALHVGTHGAVPADGKGPVIASGTVP